MKRSTEEIIQAVVTITFFASITFVLSTLEPYAPKVRASVVEIIRGCSISGKGNTTQEQFDDLRRKNHEHADRMREIWDK